MHISLIERTFLSSEIENSLRDVTKFDLKLSKKTRSKSRLERKSGANTLVISRRINDEINDVLRLMDPPCVNHGVPKDRLRESFESIFPTEENALYETT